MKSALYRDLCMYVEARAVMDPGMYPRLSDLAWHFGGLGLGMASILAASDEALLEAQGFGPRSLAAFRTVVPGGPSWRLVFFTDLLWEEHAAMVAGAR